MSVPKMAMVEHETWIREFIIKRNNVLLGTDGWGIEFALFEVSEPESAILKCTEANGRAKWLQDGVVRITVPSNMVDDLDFKTAGFYLKVVDVDENDDDPNGVSYVTMRGTLDYFPAVQYESTGMRTY